MAAYIAFGIGLGGIVLLLLIKSAENRRGVRFAETVRRRADHVATEVGTTLAQLPEYSSTHGQTAWAHALRTVGAFVAHTIVVVQRVVRQFREVLHRRVMPIRKTRTVSAFLAHVAEHKRRITRDQN